ncbi:chitin biosynthesis [Pyrenophora seminiperda CCB06]|uniref:Chitin biosynthesis n=1 Tax=Pyrenophora seminiperda CCB06 TaxID=1302712 RepID=A0A3M7MI51_9PLEO|nr:chitin biosynthesis [Pyrenophora seminiperda CCB06]
MKSFFSLIARNRPKTFTVSYSPDYKNLIINHVATDPSHPLHETQKRRQRERKKEGLWWHATTGVDLNKSSCVRTWARRRLRNAVKDELELRGYNENGILAQPKATPDSANPTKLRYAAKLPNLTGSLRLHVQAPLLPAKYADIRAETRGIIDALVQAAGSGTARSRTEERPSLKPLKTRPPWNPRVEAQRQQARKMANPLSPRTG